MSVAREDVVAAYRLILGREPESAEVVDAQARMHADRRSLMNAFLASPEYQQSAGRPASTVEQPPRRLWPAPAMQVDVQVGAADLAACLARIHAEWDVLGQHEPHWSVVTDERYRQGAIGQNLDAFYASGGHDAQPFADALERFADPAILRGCCLELGCGVGRVTTWLARHFARVIATDISAPHLRIAGDYCRARNIGNVEFVRLDTIDRIRALPQVEAFFSVIALQHNPPPVMARLLSDLMGRLKAGGLAMVQFPTHRAGYRFRVADYLARAAAPAEMEMHVLPQHEVFRLVDEAGCRVVETYPDNFTGAPNPEREVSSTFVITRPRRAA
jgi:SAM-dependent methyltransferase